MATYTVTTSKHATLTANTVDTITITGRANDIEVLNRGTTELHFTINGATPTVGGDDTYIVPAGGALRVPATNVTATKLIATTSIAYSVTAL